VSAVKRALRQSGAGKWKVGHGGTLHRLVPGVLPIAVGEYSNHAAPSCDSHKIYEFTV